MPRRIIVMNNATEQMLGLDLNPQQRLFAAKAALRNAWLARPGDIIVSRVPIGRDFEDYVCRTLGYAPHAFTVVCPEEAAGEHAALADALLLSDAMVDALRRRIGDPADWRMLPCYQTEGTARLEARLGLPDSVGRRFAEQRGTDLLNRKSHFRQLATGAGLPLAEGCIVSTPAGLAEAIARLVDATGNVIVKRDNGAGGTGNIVVTRGPASPMPGACETLPQAGLPADPDALWARLAGDRGGPLVVESYHSARAMFYLEFHIGDDGTLDYLASGAIRVRPHDDPEAHELFWVGLELPADLSFAVFTDAMVHAARFARLAAAMGYRGHINIDAIVTEAGALVFNEANARWGGGTVLHHVAAALLGPGFADTHVVSSFRDVPAPSLPATLAILHEHGLHYDAERGRGILVLACDDQFTHSIEALLIARTREEIRELERRLLGALHTGAGLAA